MGRFTAGVLLMVSAAALGNQNDGWDLSELSEWNDDSVAWASDIHPDGPSEQFLLDNIPPPPRELWCVDESYPEDCDAWEYHMTGWLHTYLDVPFNESLPQLAAFPKECASSCDLY